MKDRIIERLLTEGHITIEMADAILNNKHGKTEIISDLANDGNITKLEAVALLKEKESGSYIPNYPLQTNPWIGPGLGTSPYQPYQPYIPNQPINVPYCDWHTGTGNPNAVTFTSTSTSDLNKNYTDK